MPALPFVHRPGLLIAGLIVFVVGWMLRRWAGRHDLVGAVKGAAVTAVWQGVKGGKASAIPDELKSRMAEFHNEGSNTGRAKKAAGLAVRQVLAKFVGIAGLIALLAGLAMSVAAFLWP